MNAKKKGMLNIVFVFTDITQSLFIMLSVTIVIFTVVKYYFPFYFPWFIMIVYFA